MTATSSRKPAALVFGLGLVICLALLSTALTSRHASEVRRAPAIDLQVDGPLGYGDKVSIAVAERRTTALPVPPESAVTGHLTGLCVNGGDSTYDAGYVWDTNLVFLVHPGEGTEDKAVAGWTTEAAEHPEEGWTVVVVRGHTGLGRTADADGPASLTWMERGLGLQLVAGDQSLEELQLIAEAIAWR